MSVIASEYNIARRTAVQLRLTYYKIINNIPHAHPETKSTRAKSYVKRPL